MLLGTGGKCFECPLYDALTADVDPTAGGHLSVHRETKVFEAAEFVPSRPRGYQLRIADDDARRILVRLQHTDRLAGLHEQRLIILQRFKLADDRIVALPITSSFTRTSID